MTEDFFSIMVGGTISNVNRICDLISIEIISSTQEELYLHIQSFFRIIKKNKIILSSEDIYRCGKNHNREDFAWDLPGMSVFDESLEKNKSDILGASIKKVKKEDCGDLMISMNNDLCLQVVIDTSETEERYRIFDSEKEFIVGI